MYINYNIFQSFDKVILVSDDGKVQVGNPYVANAKVEGKVVSNGKAKKILVFKYKAKKNERKTRGHRQDYTKVEITSIKVKAEKAEKAEKTEKAAKQLKQLNKLYRNKKCDINEIIKRKE